LAIAKGYEEAVRQTTATTPWSRGTYCHKATGERAVPPPTSAIIAAAAGATIPLQLATETKLAIRAGQALEQMESQCQSPEAALSVAQAGLAKAYEL
jgi:hypothetical protein